MALLVILQTVLDPIFQLLNNVVLIIVLKSVSISLETAFCPAASWKSEILLHRARTKEFRVATAVVVRYRTERRRANESTPQLFTSS